MRRLRFALPLGMAFTTAQAVEIMTWERLPLPVPLHVGQERVIFIDQNVRVGVPRALTDTLRIQSTGGALYLRASAPIAPTRLQLQDVRTGEIILVDIAATEGNDQSLLEPVKIVKGSRGPKRYGSDPKQADIGAEPFSPDPAQATPERRETPIPVVLTRYAAQSLYAPLRTVERLPGVIQIKQRRGLDLTNLMPTQPVNASLLGAWQLENYFVSAIKLSNTSALTLSLDPRELQGDFITATFQHQTLGPVGVSTDTSVVYLVTRGKTLAEALPPSVSQIDASINLKPSRVGAHAQ
ncbi:TIGR03749 family integrating conjugative element protein [Pseudomonas sp. Y39-6]|uniref:TIGR03749 family integrating conjugative element protein n=1 Tax=Pseudomonas sp. Y39-6 TaxID=2749807 RepID=UPI001910BEB6|nr:TIGR03749 family integrating conjugative element protein [Pseudomonas sp. Y39-6]QPO21991.1 TIGR03749 family integrating conjugative element protein [Pseudomonas sp. Y39-6]URS59312.1 TIGR03749 family integrating conjugative element protein [Pseudomonas sp. Y39-6]